MPPRPYVSIYLVSWEARDTNNPSPSEPHWYLDKEYTTREKALQRLERLFHQYGPRYLRGQIHQFDFYQDTGELILRGLVHKEEIPPDA